MSVVEKVTDAIIEETADDDLAENIVNIIIDTLTDDLSEFIADHCGIDCITVTNIIRDYLGYNATPVKSTTTVNIRIYPPTKAPTSGVKRCPFVFTRRGKKKEVCNTAIRGSCMYCSKHKNRKIAKLQLVNTSA